MKVSFYYQEMATPVSQTDELVALIKMHVDSFSLHGWEVVQLDEKVARQHPLYDLFDNPATIFATSKNNWEYTRACYMRWLAYAVAGHPFADFDVINYGFTVEDAQKQRTARKAPIFLSLSCAVGLVDAEEYDEIISVFLEFQSAPRIEGWTKIDVNDLNIIVQYRPEWIQFESWEDPGLVSKDYTTPGWERARLVHYPYYYTPEPRSRVIQQVRPPLV